MRGISGLVKRFGWLPLGQAIVLTISMSGFAVLARVLGPGPYAKFAVILFVFTATSLFVDLSPQGFMIVRRGGRQVTRLAIQLTIVSAVAGAALLAIAVGVANTLLLRDPINLIELAVLEVAYLAQMTTQVPRARLVLAQRYRSMALIDIGSTLSGIVVAIAIALLAQSAIALTAQLASTAVLRAIITAAAASRAKYEPISYFEDDLSVRDAIRYGLRVIPLNLASYLSRSLDSGILPGILPATAAAGYSRSYQLVIVPLTQLQLSLGPAVLDRLSSGFTRNGEHSASLSRRLWKVLEIVATVSGAGIIALSSVIQTVLFGSGWPMVNVMIAAMACMLPALAIATYCSWTLQVTSRIGQTMGHFGVMMIAPLLVIAGALLGGTQLALTSLVFGAGFQSVVLALMHRKIIPIRVGALVARLGAIWLLMAFLSALIATVSGFWDYEF